MAEACYKEPYLPASFKLIPFKAIEATSEHGRRGAEGEFPFGEQTAYADLGRKIRTYTIRAKFDGNDHVLRAAALIAACELPNPGILTHPTRGVILSAACRSIRVTDNVEEEQGITYVDLEFVEANNWPNGLSLVGQLLGLGLNAIIGASRSGFLSRYKPSTVQPFRKAAVVGAAQNQVANIASAYEQATTAKANDESRQRILFDLNSVVTDASMAELPDIMDKSLALGMNAVALELSGREKYTAFRNIANDAARTSSFVSPAGDVENAIYSNVRVIAASYMTEAALEEENVRTGEIFAQLDAVESILTQEANYARDICDNELYLAITKFKDEAMAKLYNKAYDSPGLVEYNFGGGVHPLVAAYSIYGDAKKHRDVESINLLSGSGRVGPMVVAARGLNS